VSIGVHPRLDTKTGRNMAELLVIAHGKLQRGPMLRTWAGASERLRQIFGDRVEIRFTAAPGDATRLAREALRDGVDWLVAAGGDGTIHEVVNGFFRGPENVGPRASLSFLPCGSGNDWVRTLNIPASTLEAVERLPTSRIRFVDVGFAGYQAQDGSAMERVFLNVAEAGVGGRVVTHMKEGLFPALGGVSYRLSTIAAALTGSRPELRLAFDGNPIVSSGPALSLIVAGGRYFGAGMHCAPMARPDDGLLEVITLGDFGRVELLLKARRFFSGSYLDDPKVRHRSVRMIEATSDERVLLEMDGELVGTLPARIRVLPGALAIRY
jgi:YegS/Rv2252/BmrU family lipid kinase